MVGLGYMFIIYIYLYKYKCVFIYAYLYVFLNTHGGMYLKTKSDNFRLLEVTLATFENGDFLKF